jgi:hypothetical protein
METDLTETYLKASEVALLTRLSLVFCNIQATEHEVWLIP